MPWSKRLADGLTAARMPLGLGMIWVALAEGRKGVAVATVLLLITATVDTLDGYFARRSGYTGQTWIGAHDLEFDIVFSVALLFFLNMAGLVSLFLAVPYFGIWMIVFWQQDSISNAVAVLFQAPIYIRLLLTAIQDTPALVWWLLLWLAVMITFAGKRFFEQRLPKLVRELQDIFHLRSREEN